MDLDEDALARIEKNRQKALQLRKGKIIPNPSTNNVTHSNSSKGTKLRDTGGGFFLEETTEEETPKKPVSETPLDIFQEKSTCIKCDSTFLTSWYLDKFSYACCDTCRNDKEMLITKTEAASQYLLKNCDFESREPPLKYVSNPNPHNPRWGEMKLYLHPQVHDRAMEVWGSEEALEARRDERAERAVSAKAARYQKRLKELRMNTRSSLYDRTTRPHQHEFGEEVHKGDDVYCRKCSKCSYEETYEKI